MLTGQNLRRWLEEHGTSPEAGRAFQSWLSEGGDRELVRPFLAPWLEAHGDKAEAELVFNSWLSAHGERDVIGPFVKPWLKLHGEKPEAQYFLNAWLSSGGKYHTVQPFLIKWLSLHCKDFGASYVLRAWLGAGGDPLLVRPCVASWLAVHGDTPEATFVLRPWLAAGGDFDLVRDPAFRWLGLHRESFEASFLVRSLGKQPDLPLETVRDILAWCRRFSRHQQALWAITGLGNRLLLPEIAGEVAQTCRLLLEIALGESEVALTTKLLVIRLFGILAKDRELRSGTSLLFLNWLSRPRLYGYDPNRLDPANLWLHNKAQNPSILLYIKELIAAGVLSVDRDQAVLRRLFAWIGTWDQELRIKSRRRLAELPSGAGEFPEP